MWYSWSGFWFVFIKSDTGDMGEERREVVEREETGKGKLDKNCLALGAGGDKSPVLFDGGEDRDLRGDGREKVGSPLSLAAQILAGF
ncbi:unnamed protein product [Fusarium graminearum]|uniref:Uncharacterized protein n=1 Tax=Gibberella zeae (strain ATCC MYA-4620 / CBS 123657 / FGSC 9075 / NRRL 31084 / PH-1) TaxID=229533 RepID=A0A098D2W5_GIBZE|nr:unnamed protein product [Fusarium graminearum]